MSVAQYPSWKDQMLGGAMIFAAGIAVFFLGWLTAYLVGVLECAC